MSIIEQLQIISFALAASFAVVVVQVIVLSRILRSKAWFMIASGLLVIGARQIWNFLNLPTAIMKAREMGIVIPERLTTEQMMTTGAAFLAIGLLIAGFDRLRRDLRKIGI